jgi:succinate-acetate transporter protein
MVDERQGTPAASHRPDAGPEEKFWLEQSRIMLQPVAFPSVLGLFGFAAATFIVSANLAGWYGDSVTTPAFLAPFAATFGGVAQSIAGIWAFKARDSLATAMHGAWGAFWIAFGMLHVLDGFGAVTLPTGDKFPALGFWLLALAVITGLGTIAAIAENLSMTLVLGTLTVGAALLAVSLLVGNGTLLTVAAWVLMVSSWLATYTAAAIMIASTWGRTVLPLGKYARNANVPGAVPFRPIEYRGGMPGVTVGQ